MTENDSKSATNRPRSYSLVMPLLFAGMLFALAGNVYQALKAARFEHHVDLMQKSTQRQIADVKEAVSGVLEQNLLRYDELNKQLQSVSATAVEQTKAEVKQAEAEVKRSRSELAKTVEQRHQEVVTQLSDLRSDLREDTASKLSQISSNLERTGSQLQR